MQVDEVVIWRKSSQIWDPIHAWIFTIFKEGTIVCWGGGCCEHKKIKRHFTSSPLVNMPPPLQSFERSRLKLLLVADMTPKPSKPFGKISEGLGLLPLPKLQGDTWFCAGAQVFVSQDTMMDELPLRAWNAGIWVELTPEEGGMFWINIWNQKGLLLLAALTVAAKRAVAAAVATATVAEKWKSCMLIGDDEAKLIEKFLWDGVGENEVDEED